MDNLFLKDGIIFLPFCICKMIAESGKMLLRRFLAPNRPLSPLSPWQVAQLCMYNSLPLFDVKPVMIVNKRKMVAKDTVSCLILFLFHKTRKNGNLKIEQNRQGEKLLVDGC